MPRRLDIPCAELGAAYRAGQSTTTLAHRYACSPTTISKHLRDCGVTLRPSRFVPIPVDDAALRQAYLVERRPIASIAAEFGVSASTIGNKRRRYAIPRRPRQSEESGVRSQESGVRSSHHSDS